MVREWVLAIILSTAVDSAVAQTLAPTPAPSSTTAPSPISGPTAAPPPGAEAPAAIPPPPAQAPAPPQARVADDGVHLPVGYPIVIALDEIVSSEARTRGDKFAIHLAAPIMVDGREVAPAGAKGMGEVVYAEHTGGGGAPGKLVLAARYLDIGAVHAPLKAFNLGAGGESEFREMQVAAQIIGIGVMFINGHDVVYPVGTRARAKIAQEVVLPLPPAAPDTAPTPAPAPAGDAPALALSATPSPAPAASAPPTTTSPPTPAPEPAK